MNDTITCPHVDVGGIYGDEINRVGGFRLRCRDCGRFLDGPVSIAVDRHRILSAHTTQGEAMNDIIEWKREDGPEDFRARILPLLRDGLEVTIKRGRGTISGPIAKTSRGDWVIPDLFGIAYEGIPTAGTSSITFTRPEPEWASARIIAVGDQGNLRYRQSDGHFSHGLGVPETYWWSVRDLVENYGDKIAVVVDAERRWVL